MFLYVARRIQEGGLPYRDVWDHKPPLVYYVDVIALWLADLGLPGLFVVELAVVLTAAAAGYWTLARSYGRIPALFATVAWLSLFAVMLDGGNLPEEYALPLQFGAVALYVSRAPRRWIAIGVCAGLALLLKPTVVGIWIAIGLVEVATAARRRSFAGLGRRALEGGSGALAVLAPVVAYLALCGIAADAYDQVVRFNAAYANSTLAERWDALLAGVRLTSFTGLLPIAAVGWVLAATALARGSASLGLRPLLAVTVLALPLDILFASAPGRLHRQYFLACLPALGLLAGIAAGELGPRLARAATSRGMPRMTFAGPAFGVALALFATAVPAVAVYRAADGMTDQERSRRDATAYVPRVTRAEDRVLFWGGESGLNFTTGRRAPTRYAYQYALYLRGYQHPVRLDELLADLERDPPALIVDSSPATKDVPPLDAAERARWTLLEPRNAIPDGIERVFAWVEARYERVDAVGPLRWPVYARRGAR